MPLLSPALPGRRSFGGYTRETEGIVVGYISSLRFGNNFPWEAPRNALSSTTELPLSLYLAETLRIPSRNYCVAKFPTNIVTCGRSGEKNGTSPLGKSTDKRNIVEIDFMLLSSNVHHCRTIISGTKMLQFFLLNLIFLDRERPYVALTFFLTRLRNFIKKYLI